MSTLAFVARLLWSRRACRALLAAPLLTLPLCALIVTFAPVSSQQTFLLLSAGIVSQGLAGLGVLCAGAWAAAEFRSRTLPLVFTRGVGRVSWLLALLAVLTLGLTFLALVPPLVALPFLRAAPEAAQPLPLQVPAGLGGRWWLLMVPVWPSLALAVLLGVLTRSGVVAVAGSLLWWFVAEPLVTLGWPVLGTWLPRALGTHLVTAGGDLLPSLAGLLGYALAFVLLAALWLRRQDLGG